MAIALSSPETPRCGFLSRELACLSVYECITMRPNRHGCSCVATIVRRPTNIQLRKQLMVPFDALLAGSRWMCVNGWSLLRNDPTPNLPLPNCGSRDSPSFCAARKRRSYCRPRRQAPKEEPGGRTTSRRTRGVRRAAGRNHQCISDGTGASDGAICRRIFAASASIARSANGQAFATMAATGMCQ